MRRALALLSLTGLLAACMSDPHLELFEPTTNASARTAPAMPTTPSGGEDIDASSAADTSVPEPTPTPSEDASTPSPTPTNPPAPPAPPGATCPPAGAPASTQCCGVGGAGPACTGKACKSCDDCLALGCAAGMVCCGENKGQGKSMSCVLAALAGACPK